MPRGSIPLSSVNRIEQGFDERTGSHCFMLVTRARRFVFESPPEQRPGTEEWAQLLVQAKARDQLAAADDASAIHATAVSSV